MENQVSSTIEQCVKGSIRTTVSYFVHINFPITVQWCMYTCTVQCWTVQRMQQQEINIPSSNCQWLLVHILDHFYHCKEEKKFHAKKVQCVVIGGTTEYCTLLQLVDRNRVLVACSIQRIITR